jgi:hypothetical protein
MELTPVSRSPAPAFLERMQRGQLQKSADFPT